MRPLAIATLVALVPGSALAANGMRPRSPAIFEDTPCIVTVDKAIDNPLLHFEYAVQYDDVELTPEELPDSRTMQFFALAEQRWNFKFPTWISQSDYDRALANGDITMMFTDDDIFDKTTLWTPDSWIRVTPDDARVPITMSQAAMGFDWDITDVPVGTWYVSAYTWEPENNLWSPRFGAIRIADSSAPEVDPGPTVFLQDAPSQTAPIGETYDVMGCIHADAGSIYSASYGAIEGIAEPVWQPIPGVTGVPVVNGEIVIPFEPLEMAAGTLFKVRIDVQSPTGSYTAFTPKPIEVTCSTDCGEGSSGEVETETGDSSDSDTTDPTATTTGEDDGNSQEGEGSGGGFFGGGGCRTTDPAPAGAALFLLLLGLSPRVRRRC